MSALLSLIDRRLERLFALLEKGTLARRLDPGATHPPKDTGA